MYERERKIDGIRTAPLVSVIMPAYNAEKYIEERFLPCFRRPIKTGNC